MNIPAWNSISKEFRDGLLEILILDLIKQKPDNNNNNLIKRVQEKTGNVWLQPQEIKHITQQLRKHGMIKPNSAETLLEITDHGREEIQDRVEQAQRIFAMLEAKQ